MKNREWRMENGRGIRGKIMKMFGHMEFKQIIWIFVLVKYIRHRNIFYLLLVIKLS